MNDQSMYFEERSDEMFIILCCLCLVKDKTTGMINKRIVVKLRYLLL
jgi:hypothetical protein